MVAFWLEYVFVNVSVITAKSFEQVNRVLLKESIHSNNCVLAVFEHSLQKCERVIDVVVTNEALQLTEDAFNFIKH